jgi:hypothetical protein
MTTPPLAHAGHWLAQVAYVVPLLLVVIALAVSKVRERRAGPDVHEDGDAPPPAAAAGSGEH